MIVVAGGTGRLGSDVVRSLLDSGQPVRVLARGVRPVPDAIAAAEVVRGSVSDPGVVAAALAGAEVVVSAVTGFPFVSPDRVDASGNEALAQAARRVGADVVLVSVAGASADHPMGLFRAKHRAEQTLARAGVRSTVVRPEAFADLWIDLMATSAGRSHRPLVFGRGENPRAWVAVRDVSALVVRAATDDRLRDLTLTLTGPEEITPSVLAARVMAARGWTGAPRHVPTAVLRMAARLPGRAGRQADAALAMEEAAQSVDDARAAVPGLPCTSVADLLAGGVVRHE